MNIAGAGRYAPSPSGELHVGNLRTAMLAWLFARSTGRAFLMRIEDLDRGRDAGAAAAQLRDLQAIGLDWDGDPIFQTARLSNYEAAIEQLAQRGLVYECTCTRREILEAPSAPHAPPGSYPGTCRNLSAVERSRATDRIAPRMPALRLRVPDEMRSGTFDDVVLGQVTAAIDDMVLRRGDGAIAYNLAVVVDDAAMGVDQVVRGDDLAPSTPRQILLQNLLGLPTPEYAHVPLVLGPTGARLAKRDGAVTLQQLRDNGLSAAELRAIIATSLRLANEHERPEMSELLRRFDAKSMPREPWQFWAATSSTRV